MLTLIMTGEILTCIKVLAICTQVQSQANSYMTGKVHAKCPNQSDLFIMSDSLITLIQDNQRYHYSYLPHQM